MVFFREEKRVGMVLIKISRHAALSLDIATKITLVWINVQKNIHNIVSLGGLKVVYKTLYTIVKLSLKRYTYTEMRKQSYILLIILFVAVFFIIGVRYGQRVEKFNKVVAALPTPTNPPTETPTPTLRPSLESYLSFKHDDCNIKMLIPDSFTIKEKASDSAKILSKESGESVLTLRCAQNPSTLRTLVDTIDTKNITTASLTFQGKKVEAREDSKNYYFVVSNPLRTMSIFFSVNKNVYELLNETLTFL